MSFRCAYQNPRLSRDQTLRLGVVQLRDLLPVAARGAVPQLATIDESPGP